MPPRNEHEFFQSIRFHVIVVILSRYEFDGNEVDRSHLNTSRHLDTYLSRHAHMFCRHTPRASRKRFSRDAFYTPREEGDDHYYKGNIRHARHAAIFTPYALLL